MKIKLFSLIVGLTILIITISSSYSNTDNYKNLKKIEMDVYKDGKIIGFSNYEFTSKSDELLVKNITEFKSFYEFSIYYNSDHISSKDSFIFKTKEEAEKRKAYYD